MWDVKVALPGLLAATGLGLALALAAPCALAQAAPAGGAPSASQMIEQLKAPRTRSLRNLAVEAAPSGTADAPAAGGSESAGGAPAAVAAAPGSAPAAPAPRPSLSLLIQFDFNSAKIRPESHQALANLSQALQSPELAGSRFAVEGHTDAKGPADYNRKLSEQRALAVRELLRIQGVPEARLVAAGKGASELANAADPFAAENRRVRIVNLD